MVRKRMLLLTVATPFPTSEFVLKEILYSYSHSGGTETKVKEIVSDIPPHTNQNIGIF